MPERIKSPDKKVRCAQPLEVVSNPNALLTIETVCSLTGLGRMSIYRMLKAGKFVEPVRLSIRCTRFRAAEVNAWLASR